MANYQLSNQRLTYPLLPFSQLVYDIMRWMPRVYLFGQKVRIRGGAKESDRWITACTQALRNHPVFSSRIDWIGRQYAANVDNILLGKYHHSAFSIEGEDLIIDVELNRILGDGRSIEILLEDIRRAYERLPLEQDDYWSYVARFELRKTEPHYLSSRDWLIREFADISVPVRPTIDREWLFTILPPKPGLYKSDYSDLQEKIQTFSDKNFLPLDGIFSLCTALAISDYCGTDEGALTWAYEGRETPEEQRIFGSLHRDIPFKINHKSKIINHKSDLIRLARNQIRSGIAHSDYPYTLTAPYNKRWNYAVNVLRIAEPQDMLRNIGLPIEIVSVPEPKYAYALLDVEIHEHPQDLSLWFRYSATHYKESSIRRFADLVRKYVEWLIE